MTDDAIYRMTVKIGKALWPLRPLSDLAKEYTEPMTHTLDPATDAPDCFEAPVCATCGSLDVDVDPRWCRSCEAWCELTTEEMYLAAHPEDAVE